jgi:hypothetical protein
VSDLQSSFQRHFVPIVAGFAALCQLTFSEWERSVEMYGYGLSVSDNAGAGFVAE